MNSKTLEHNVFLKLKISTQLYLQLAFANHMNAKYIVIKNLHLEHFTSTRLSSVKLKTMCMYHCYNFLFLQSGVAYKRMQVRIKIEILHIIIFKYDLWI